MKLQTPKGTRDFLPKDMLLRRKVTDILASIYRIFGFQEWDGPAFEYLETLSRKGGELVANEIYSFEDKSKRKLGLRFELTTSIARIIANNPNIKKPLKVFNIGKVWRYERPQTGRFREFLQSDTDIFGSSSMTCEIDLFLMSVAALKRIDLGEYVILLNNRKILEAQLRIAGVSLDQQVDALRALDKLSKIGKDGVRDEFEKRGINQEKFNKVIAFIDLDGDNIQRLRKTKELLKTDNVGIEGVEELEKILELSKSVGLSDSIVIDLSLVRGLDYYTGPIFEIRSKERPEVGSFAGGGRYDNLIQLFGGQPTPAVGISFGVERLIEIVSSDKKLEKSFSEVKVFVGNVSPETLAIAMKVAQQLREAGISAEFDLFGRNLSKQLAHVNANQIPYCFVIFSEKEQKLKEMTTGKEEILSVDEVIKKILSM
jgi:histidyl-tRNA synthetase